MIHEWKRTKRLGKEVCTCGKVFDSNEELEDHISDHIEED